LKIFQGKSLPLVNTSNLEQDEWTNWSPEVNEDHDIMNHLNYKKLELIYNDYEVLAPAKNGLDKATFVRVMLDHLPIKGEETPES
jgi:hypothetical protein